MHGLHMFFIIVRGAICHHSATEMLTFSDVISDVIMWTVVCSPHIYFIACLAVMFPIYPTWLDTNAGKHVCLNQGVHMEISSVLFWCLCLFPNVH